MIQSYAQLFKQVNDINDQVNEQIYIQKIYSSAQFVSLSLRRSGQTQYLFVGRGSGFEGIWLGDKQIESFIRKKDIFLEYLRKYLSATVLLAVEADALDRIVSISYQKWGAVNKVLFFFKARKLYFAHHYYDAKKERMVNFKSWSQEKLDADSIEFSIFDEVGRQKQESYKDKEFIDIDTLLEIESSKALRTSSETKKRKFLKRKLKNIENDLINVGKIGSIQNFINETSDLEVLGKKIDIDGVSIKFKEKTHFKRRDELYQKIKNFKKAYGILIKRKADTEAELVKHNTNNLRKSELSVIKPIWRMEREGSTTTKVKSGNIEVFKFDDIELGVGTNAQGNDRLRKEWAGKSDYWFHLEGDKSAHIVVKLKGSVLNDEIFRKVASAMIKFSSIDRSEVQLIYTMVKNVKGVKGAAGKVIFKKEKHIKIYDFPTWDHVTGPVS